VARDLDKFIFTMMLEITYGIGHFTMDHPKVLKEGLGASSRRPEGAAMASRPRNGPARRGSSTKRRFVPSMQPYASPIAMRTRPPPWQRPNRFRLGGRNWKGSRRSAVAVPENPAETFHEAVQSVYFVHLIAQIESGGIPSPWEGSIRSSAPITTRTSPAGG